MERILVLSHFQLITTNINENRKRFYNLFLFSVVFSLLSSSFLASADVQILSPLSFGKIVVAGNVQKSSLTVSKNYTSSSTNSIYVITPGQPAEVLVENIGANVALNVSVTVLSDFSHDLAVPTGALSLASLDYLPVVTTNAYGQAVMRIGGVLETSGDGSSYVDGNYSATVEIMINF